MSYKFSILYTFTEASFFLTSNVRMAVILVAQKYQANYGEVMIFLKIHNFITVRLLNHNQILYWKITPLRCLRLFILFNMHAC
jgi:hypothetical protein